MPKSRSSSLDHPDEPFVGRSAALEHLNEWFVGPEPLGAIVAPAGYGKTALASRWLKNQQSKWPSYALGEHSFRGQAPMETATPSPSPTDGLFGLCKTLLPGEKVLALTRAPEQLREAIVDACKAKETLLLLDGFETQQESTGRIRRESDSLQDLMEALAEVPGCKVLLLTRVPPLQVGSVTPTVIELEMLDDDEVYDLFVEARPELPLATTHDLVTHYFALGGHPLTASLVLSILRDPEQAEALLSIGADDPLEDLLTHIYSSQDAYQRLLLTALALADQPIDRSTLVRLFPAPAGGAVALPAVVTTTADRSIDLHPLVRSRIASLARTTHPAEVAESHAALASHFLGASKETQSRMEQLPMLWQAVHHRLSCGQLLEALGIYIAEISCEPALGNPRFGKVWRSVTQDYAYDIEKTGLDALVEHPGWTDPKYADSLAAFYPDMLIRQVWVDRALGEMRHADQRGHAIWRRRNHAAGDPSEILGQICLTTMIRGRVVDRALADTDDAPRYAGYWSLLALEHSEDLVKSGRLFPKIRSLVYRGAYLHRADETDLARRCFDEAAQLQRQSHSNDPQEPPVLVGVNAYLLAWFLIDHRCLSDARILIESNLSYVESLGKSSHGHAQRADQWKLMANLALGWLEQEEALEKADSNVDEARQHWRRSERLLSEAEDRVAQQPDAIAYDLRSTLIRASVRAHALKGDPARAERELLRQIDEFARTGARLFAADCQSDLLRLYKSSGRLGQRWKIPSNVQQQQAAARLAHLSRRYPFGSRSWARGRDICTFA